MCTGISLKNHFKEDNFAQAVYQTVAAQVSNMAH